MTNSVWQATIQNAAGDIVPGAEITVIDEGTGLNAVIYSSKAGAALTNPFNADAGGFAQFYSGPGEYRITAHDLGTGLTQTFDNWRLGDAGARDVGTDTGEVITSDGLILFGLGALQPPLNTDANAIRDGGTYNMSSSAIGIPIPESGIIKHGKIDDSNGTQEYIGRISGVMYSRTLTANVFSSWGLVYNNLSFTPELADGLRTRRTLRNDTGSTISSNGTAAGGGLQSSKCNTSGVRVASGSFFTGTWKNIGASNIGVGEFGLFVRVV